MTPSRRAELEQVAQEFFDRIGFSPLDHELQALVEVLASREEEVLKAVLEQFIREAKERQP